MQSPDTASTGTAAPGFSPPDRAAIGDNTQQFITFTLDGQRTSPHHSPGLVACNAVASLAATQPRAAEFVDDLWAAAIPTGKWRYYDGMLYLMGLLHVSGRFRIHAPAGS